MIIYEKDEHPLFTAMLRDVIQKGENKLISVTGGTQKGKSRWSIAAAYYLDEWFKKYAESEWNIRKRVAVIEPLDFMDVIDNSASRGSVKIYDDAGVGINAQDWHDFQVQKLSRIFHTIGNQGWIIIITTPHYSFFNSQVRAVVTDRVIVKGRDLKNNRIRFKYYSDVNYDERTGKEYKSYPVMILKNGKKRKVTSFTIKEAPTELLKKFYEIEGGGKVEFRKESIQEVRREHEIRQEAKKTSAEKVSKIITEILENPQPFVKEWGGRRYIDQAEIELQKKVGGRIAVRVKKAVEKALGIE